MDDKKTLGNLVSRLSEAHVELWHEEDKARVDNDAEVAKAKRRIDQLNHAILFTKNRDEMLGTHVCNRHGTFWAPGQVFQRRLDTHRIGSKRACGSLELRHGISQAARSSQF